MSEYTRPVWHNDAGQGDPAQFEHWGRISFWTAQEAAELALNIEPNSANHLRNDDPLSMRVRRLRTHIERAVQAGQLPGQPDCLRPVDFVRWASEQSVDLPDALRLGVPPDRQEVTVLSNGVVSAGEASNNEGDNDAPLSTRERNTLFRMILGMAIRKYRYRPGERGGAPKSISDDLRDLNLTVSDDTVRKWLDEAVVELDFQLPKKE